MLRISSVTFRSEEALFLGFDFFRSFICFSIVILAFPLRCHYHKKHGITINFGKKCNNFSVIFGVIVLTKNSNSSAKCKGLVTDRRHIRTRNLESDKNANVFQIQYPFETIEYHTFRFNRFIVIEKYVHRYISIYKIYAKVSK